MINLFQQYTWEMAVPSDTVCRVIFARCYFCPLTHANYFDPALNLHCDNMGKRGENKTGTNISMCTVIKFCSNLFLRMCFFLKAAKIFKSECVPFYAAIGALDLSSGVIYSVYCISVCIFVAA